MLCISQTECIEAVSAVKEAVSAVKTGTGRDGGRRGDAVPETVEEEGDDEKQK